VDAIATQLDWNQTRAFLITAQQGSFSAAARTMGLTQPTLGRQIAALEESLQVVLFEKSGRGLVLTPTGQELLEHAERMGEAALDFTLAATGSSESMKGSVCVSATELTAGCVLPNLTQRFKQQHPDILIEILASNDSSDLRKREADIAIRSYRPTQPDLIGKKLGLQRWVLYASTDFVSKHGTLDDKKALESAGIIGFDPTDSILDHFKAQDIHLVSDNIVVVAQNMLVGLELIKNGSGVGVLPVEIGDRQAGLCRVAKDLVQFEVDNWLVTHSELRTNKRIRKVFDFIDAEITSLLESV